MVKCNHCNTENEENATHCQNCGEKLPLKKTKKGFKKIVLMGIGILLLIGVVVAILMFTSTSEVSEFDQELINSVRKGESIEGLISQIEEHSEANRQVSKAGYESLVSRESADSTFLEEAKKNHVKELEYIQKIEDLQIRFVKGEINEETFIKELKELYVKQPEIDY